MIYTPYIQQEHRRLYDEYIDNILFILEHIEAAEAAGHFTYIIYRLMKRFNGKFWMRALCIGCLLCAILEMYRRNHSIYEDSKIEHHGDV